MRDFACRFRPAGDTGLLVELGDRIAPEVHLRIRGLFHALQKNPPKGIVEAVPAYCSILILYDPGVVALERLKGILEHLAREAARVSPPEAKLVEIPVIYGGRYGPDLDFVAGHNGITPEEAVEIHSGGEYLVYLVGFSPGFPFLGGLDRRLHTPRLETPRKRVPQGSVAIANEQTGIYSVASPGGWRIIGRTPIRLYRPEMDPPALIQMGDRVRFKRIGPEEYERLSGERR